MGFFETPPPPPEPEQHWTRPEWVGPRDNVLPVSFALEELIVRLRGRLDDAAG